MKGNNDVQKLLCELIAIPSVNPAFLPKNDTFTGEQQVADFLATCAASAGLPVEFQEVLPNRSNFLTRLSPTGRTRQRVLLAPHLDTVGLPGDLGRMFVPVTNSSRIHGRGACDTKGSVAAMFTALTRVARSGARPRETEVVFVGLIDEENAQVGSRALAAKGLRANLAIVGEPTELKVVTAHKGDLWWRLECRGRSAHGAQPYLGQNAVHKMAKVVDVLETDYAQDLRNRPSHPLLGTATINVGSITGGTQPNIVPDQCCIRIDRRTLPGETEAQIRKEILSHLRRRGLRATIHDERGRPCIALETSVELPMVKTLFGVAKQRRSYGVNYFCDAAVLAAGGIPSIVFGPGNIAQAHTDNEWITEKSLSAATAILERFLRSLP